MKSDQRWPYSSRYVPAAPQIHLEISGTKLECVVDSGFAGGVLVPFSRFESLGLLRELVKGESRVVMPDSRSLPLFTSSSTARIGPIEIKTDVHSSPALERTLVGREFMRNFVAVLNGPEEVLSVSRG